MGLACLAGCGDDGGGPEPAGLCAAKRLTPWSRARLGVGGAVTFNEVMYRPAGAGADWVELYNPLAIDFDVSGFRIGGAASHTFAEGTRIPARGFAVVEVALPDGGGALELWNNSGRLLDAVTYDDLEPWPVLAAGSGASLAKRLPLTASEAAEAWTASAAVGGTPGAANVEAAGGGLAFNEVAGGGDDFWLELANAGAAPLEVGGHVIASSAGGEHVLPPGLLAPGELLLVDAPALGFAAAAGDALFLFAPGRAGVLDGIRTAEVPRGRHADGGWRYPDAATPGAPNVFVEHDAIVISEIMYHSPPRAAADGALAASPLEWIELHNRTTEAVDVGGWQLVDAVAYEVPAGTVIPAGGRLVVTDDLAEMLAAYPDAAPVVGNFAGSLANGGERIELRDACGNPVDVVAYADGGAWPAAADGAGASLELRDPHADNRAAEVWAASDEGARAAWQTITYEGLAAPSAVGPDGLWQELVIGLLDAGVVMIDDVSVVVDPAGAATELITGGSFESGASRFRLIGNHRHSAVIVDPTDPANHVLRLVATGPTEHMHNHLETTLAGGHQITNGRRYRISLRARWESGSNQLNTRLYFNRLARTTAVARPDRPGTPGAANSTAADNVGPTYRDLRHAPVVPAPAEPVTVSVRAADPDGVAALTLWYAAAGAAPVAVPMTADGDRFTAVVPGHTAATVVQFWIDGADAAGAASMFPARGPASRALWKVDDGLAATNGLHNLRIVATPADTAWLFTPANLMSNDLLGATVIDEERDVYYDVGVRLKSSERGRPSTLRVGFALRFTPAQPFRGVHRSVLIDRSQGVGYGQRELLFFQALNHAGSVFSQYDDLIQVLAPLPAHTGPAHLQLARYGDLLLDFQFDDGADGDLYEYELIYYPTTTDDGTPTGNKLPQPDSVVGTGIRGLGPDEEAYRLTFMLKNNRWRDDYRRFIEFAGVFGQSGAAFDSQVDGVADVDQWLRAFAFATLSGAIDNYASGAQHNAELYVRPSDGRVLYFPHDLDFLGTSRGPVVASPDLAKLIAVPARARLYYGHLHDIITTSFNGTYMAYWSAHLGALLPGQDFAGHLAYITDRAAWVMNLAPNAVTVAIPPVAFQFTTPTPQTVATPTIAVDGRAWVDLDRITLGGAPLNLTWPTTTTWRTLIPLACGASSLALTAVDRRGATLGTTTLAITRTCP